MKLVARKRFMSKLCMLIVIALLASFGASAGAKEAHISCKDAFDKTVVLYEKLQNNTVQIPQGMDDGGFDESFLKSVVLGYANLSDSDTVYAAETIRKQDMINILYKTVINYDDSYAITAQEADLILNNCYDNAYIDEENRIAYAFMMKHGVISVNRGSEPNKELTEEGCEILINEIYNRFAKQISFELGETVITTGSNISTVIDELGMPNRIDKSLYGFEWYVYNSEPTEFVMIGVQADRICAVYSNSEAFGVGNVSVGDAYIKATDYKTDNAFSFYLDKSGNIDAIMYNVAHKEAEYTEDAEAVCAIQILDMINASRAKNGLGVYAVDIDLNETVAAVLEDGSDEVLTAEGFDVFCTYNALVNSDSEILNSDATKNFNAGVAAYIDENSALKFGMIIGEEKVSATAIAKMSNTVELEETVVDFTQVEEVTTPVIVTPATETVYNDGDDVVIELAIRAATQYHIEVFDVENDEYAVNEYITTDSTQITLPAELFTNGADYRIIVSSIAPDGVSLSSEDVLISYGEAYENGVTIVTPFAEGSTDDDYLAVSWSSEQYHDFILDLYDSEGNLVTSELIKDEYEAVIHGIEPGDYFIYVTALRRNTNVEKAQASVAVTVNAPIPVITETIMDKNDEYYFVYEDESMGVLYFYDQEIVDVQEKDANGKVVTTKKKKIIQKQVKATQAYRDLAKNQRKIEKVTGEPKIDFYAATPSSGVGQDIVNTASKYLGVPYVWGGTTPNGFDCSGLVQYVLKELGIDISRVTYTQCEEGVPVAKGDLQPGDLVFFEKNGDVHHVGIYIGDGKMIHAPQTGDVVRIADMNSDYYTSTYYCARRVY